ncbi:MAG TPA: flagellar biosynthetic protein FliO [Hyphomicrobiales bacterium]|nr:flagellar biosynthetic protein FliO [Hyphomicrobiales bacterium]
MNKEALDNSPWRRIAALRGARTLRLFAACWLLWPMAGWCADAAPMPMPAPAWSNLLQVLLALGFTVGLIVLLAWGSRRLKLIAPPTPQVFSIRGTLALGARERLYLIEVGGEQLVVGAGPAGLRNLHVLREPIASEGTETGGQGALGGFGAVLAQWSRERRS